MIITLKSPGFSVILLNPWSSRQLTAKATVYILLDHLLVISKMLYSIKVLQSHGNIVHAEFLWVHKHSTLSFLYCMVSFLLDIIKSALGVILTDANGFLAANWPDQSLTLALYTTRQLCPIYLITNVPSWTEKFTNYSPKYRPCLGILVEHVKWFPD